MRLFSAARVLWSGPHLPFHPRSLFLLAAFLSTPWAVAGAEPDPHAFEYAIVVTGGELLEGAYPDGHTHFITRTLYPLGLRCVGATIVDDRQDDIQEALRSATSKVPLVIVTGGLGPTDNDITRETLADFTGIPIAEEPEVLAAMARRFGAPADGLRANLRRQTQVPARGTYFKNPNGSAVGLAFDTGEKVIVALPGPPRELQAMVRDELVPYLSRRFGTRLPGHAITLRFVGLGQSQIDETLKQHVPLAPDIATSSQFDGARVDFTFSLPDDTPDGRARLERLKQEVIKHLGDSVYADDQTTLEEHVVALLGARGATLALAEAGSGGSLTAALTGAEAAGRVLAGAYVAPSDDGIRRMLGVPDARWAGAPANEKTGLLAAAAAEAAGSQWSIAVGEPRAQEGARVVDVVFRRPDGAAESRAVRLRGSDAAARSGLVTQLLDQFRRMLR